MTLDLEELVAELEKNRQSIDEWIKKSDEATALLLENMDLLDEPGQWPLWMVPRSIRRKRCSYR
jgi:hypothetical protein